MKKRLCYTHDGLHFQGSFPGNLQLVLVLRPTTLLQRTLSDILFKFNKDEFKMKVPVCGIRTLINYIQFIERKVKVNVLRTKWHVCNGMFPSQVIMLSSITELHSYIDRTQLTQELGGTQEYCHEKWISQRTV